MKLPVFLKRAVLAVSVCMGSGVAHAASDCPNDGTVRFGVEPFEASAQLAPAYGAIGRLLSEKLGCPVQVFVASSYNAEIEAMRNGKLDIGEFGPLGYVLAHKVAHAEAVASWMDPSGKPSTYTASIATWRGSGINTLADVNGQTIAYSDPASASGHLFPAYGLKKAGIDPDRGVRPMYAGSHTASFEALRNHKVKTAELNSVEIASAKQHNEYDDGSFITLWQSDPVPGDPIAIHDTLPAPFRQRLIAVLSSLDLRQLPEDAQKYLSVNGSSTLRTVAQNDAAYDVIRSLVETLHIDLNKL